MRQSFIEKTLNTVQKKNENVLNVEDSNDNNNNNDENALNYSVESDDAVEIVEKKKRKRNEWIEKEHFNTLEEAVAFVTGGGYSAIDQKSGGYGVKYFYRCNKIKRAAETKCASQKIIWGPSDRRGYIILETDADHNHEELPKKSLATGKYNEELVKFVIECKKNGSMPKAIIRRIHEKKEAGEFQNIDVPKPSQIAYILDKYSPKADDDINDLGEFNQWCQNHSNIPDDENTPFVVNSESSEVGQTFYFRVVLSTRRLLMNGIDTELSSVDTTYKLNWQGYPLLVMGTIDANKSFHLIAIACCKYEKQQDYEFMMQSVKDAIKNILGREFAPKVIVSDAADAIPNAFYAVFTESAEKNITCYAHTIRNVAKYKLVDKTNRSKIVNDVGYLHLSKSKEEFEYLSNLFVLKWIDVEEDFTKYFEDFWLNRHSNWLEIFYIIQYI